MQRHRKSFEKSHEKVRNSDILMIISHDIMRTWEKQLISLNIVYYGTKNSPRYSETALFESALFEDPLYIIFFYVQTNCGGAKLFSPKLFCKILNRGIDIAIVTTNPTFSVSSLDISIPFENLALYSKVVCNILPAE